MADSHATPNEPRNDSESPPGSYVFIGPRNSGKTVLFVTAVEQFFRLAADKKIKNCELSLSFSSDPEQQLSSEKFFRHTSNGMQRGLWPDQSVSDEHHVVQLTRKGWLYDSQKYMVLCDYPGMAFDAAFGQSADFSDPTGEICRQANNLRREVSQSPGVFLTMDSECLYNGTGSGGVTDAFLEQLTRLAQFLDTDSDPSAFADFTTMKDPTPQSTFFPVLSMASSLYSWLTTGQRKLAVLFTKSDLMPDDFDFKKAIMDINPYLLASFKKLKNVDLRFFRVSAVPITTAEKGVRIPKDWRPEKSVGLTNAFAWMLGMELPADCLSPNADLGGL